jgi:hypothetical protein
MKINFLGDVYIDRVYAIDLEVNDYIFNMEYPLSTSGIPAKGKVNLGVDVSYIKESFSGNLPLAVNLANNHIMDYGEESYKDTILFLEKNNILYFGAGNKANNFNNPCLIKQNEKKISLLGYCCSSTCPIFGGVVDNGSAPLNLDLIKKDIEEQKKNSDFIIVNLHWGDEEISYPKPLDMAKARKIIDMGADLIIGHHAHAIQSIEVYKGKYIFYGLGNFLFPNLNAPAGYDGDVFTHTYNKIQNSKNRKSIIIELDDNQNISHKTTYFDDKKVVLKEANIPKWLPKSERVYANYRKVWLRMRMLELYFNNPRIPTLKQLKLFLGIKV